MHPFPKSKQLARGAKRYRRKVASAKQWEAIVAAKAGPCRVCVGRGVVQYHHLVFREHCGDDVAANIVPLCPDCHDAITRRVETIGRILLSRLSDAEYAYLIDRGGEDYPERAYGVTYQR